MGILLGFPEFNVLIFYVSEIWFQFCSQMYEIYYSVKGFGSFICCDFTLPFYDET